MPQQGQKVPLKAAGVEMTSLRENGEQRLSVRSGGARGSVDRRSILSADYDSDEEEESFFARFQVKARRTIKSYSFNMLMAISFTYALFGRDGFNYFEIPDHPWNLLLDAGMSFVTIIFVLEITLYWAGDYEEYAFSLLFLVDFLSVLSMLFEISYLLGDAGETEKMNDEASAKVEKATNAAKIGSRAFRFLKLLKVLNYMQRAERGSFSAEEWKRKALSRSLKNTLSNKIAVLTIFMVICLPFLQLDQYVGRDMSVILWCERLEFNYQRAYKLLQGDESLDSTDEFAQVIRDMDNFYKDSVASPFKVEGFPEKLEIDGRAVTIKGASVLQAQVKGNKPSREEFIREYAVRGDKYNHHRDWHGATEVKVYMDIVNIVKLRALENIMMVFFVLFVVLWSSNDMRRSVEPLLDVEKQAEFAKLLMKKSIVEDDEMEELSVEGRAVISDMLDLGPKKRRIFRAHSKSFTIHDKVADNLPLREDVINSYEVHTLDLDKNGRSQIMLYVFFDSEVSNKSGRRFTTPVQFQSFWDIASSKYNDVPYHNVAHAVDVTHTAFRVLVDVQSAQWATDTEHYAVLLSAVCHDVGHQGQTNAFCVETRHEFALRYNDASPLENMHCATMFEICRLQDMDMFNKMDAENKKLARKVCINVILHTDLVHHFQMVKDLDICYQGDNKEVLDKQAKSPFTISDEYGEILQQHHMLMLELILHQADISNPLKSFESSKAWAWKVLEEFFAQGDKEKELGIPVGMLNDRDKINSYGSQHGFIVFLVSPLIFGAANMFQPLYPLVENMADNLWEWHKQWTLDAKPPAADVEKRAAEVGKIEDKVKALAQRGMVEDKTRLGSQRYASMGARSTRSAATSSKRGSRRRASQEV